MNIYEKICNIMEEVSYVQKEDKKVNGQYTFVSHDAVSARLHPYLAKNKIVVVPTIKDHSSETVVSRKRDRSGNLFEDEYQKTTVTLLMRFVNAEDSKDCFEIESIGYGIDNQDKGIGKAVSYAYKYGLLKVFCLETGDDPERDLTPVQKPAEKVIDWDLISKRFSDQKDLKTLEDVYYNVINYYLKIEDLKHNEQFNKLYNENIARIDPPKLPDDDFKYIEDAFNNCHPQNIKKLKKDVLERYVDVEKDPRVKALFVEYGID